MKENLTRRDFLKISGVAALGVSTTLALAACSGDGNGDNTTDGGNVTDGTEGENQSTGGTGTGTESGPKTVVWGSYDAQQSLDNFGSGTTAVFPRIALLFEDHLFDANHDGTYEPWVATEWTWSEDYPTLTCKLRDDVYFHSGDRLVAEDVKFTFDCQQQYLEESVTSTTLIGDIDNVEAPDEQTVIFHFVRPTASFMSDSMNYGIINLSAWEEDPDFWSHPDTSGPYLLDKFDSSTSEFEFTRWDEWWGWDDEHATNVEKIIYRGITDTTSRVSTLRAGEVNIIDDVPLDQLQILRYEGFLADSYYRDRPYYLGLQHGEQSPFHDYKLRRAFYLCIDRDALCTSVLGGGTPADWPVSPTMMGYDPENAKYEYNVEEAKKLVEESSYNGEEVVFLINNVIHAHAAELA